ncbi:MAG: peptidoglycan-binding protein, partial [Acidobacteriaceae bacterium]|nr:peptidoglycan-binding protein [Acidobacteriaceae bacterium]
MNRVFTLMLVAFAITACAGATPKKAKKASSTGAANIAPKNIRTGASRGIKAKTGNASAASVKNVKYVRNRRGKLVRVAARTAPAPTYQLHPDPERYQEIQQALADRGYFKGQVNGQWGDDSIAALQRFQTDQKLDNDGHLSALSLTALGLGPKHDAYVGATPALV